MRRARQKSLLTKFPIGTYLKTKTKYYYVVSEDRLLSIISKRVLNSWAPPRLVHVEAASLQRYKVSGKLKFRNGSIVKSFGDGHVWLIEQSLRRHITDPDTVEQLGGRLKDIIYVSQEEIELHQEGEPL